MEHSTTYYSKMYGAKGSLFSSPGSLPSSAHIGMLLISDLSMDSRPAKSLTAAPTPQWTPLLETFSQTLETTVLNAGSAADCMSVMCTTRCSLLSAYNLPRIGPRISGQNVQAFSVPSHRPFRFPCTLDMMEFSISPRILRSMPIIPQTLVSPA